MKFFLLPLVIIFQFSDMAHILPGQSFDSIPTALMIVNKSAALKRQSQAESFVVKYSAPTISITVNNLQLLWSQRIESYRNPISATPSQVIIQTKNKKLTNSQLAELKKLIQSSGFMNLESEYGVPNNQIYYPYSISICLGNKQKKVFFRSHPTSGSSPKAFRQVEDYLQRLIK